MRSLRTLVLVCLLVPAAAHADGVVPALPANIDAPAAYRSLMEAMLDRSPTFRRQCVRIASAAHLTIIVRSGPIAMADTRAMTRIDRRADGSLVASVLVGERDDPTELLAHELEHVIEQLDGVDLASLANRPVTGVQRTTGGGFDTVRAIRVGERVAQEVRAAALVASRTPR